MTPRSVAALALVFSGTTALVYEIVWSRLLGFAFGTTSEAIGTVLAVFFGGLALGNALAARFLHRVQRPLRVYAWLEVGVGLFALASLPALRALPALTAWLGAEASETERLALRLGLSAALLLPPTLAMGATLPVVARGVVGQDSSRGRWSGVLYAANTLGSVSGAYLCGFWLVPWLGLTRTVLLSAGVNLAVAAAVLLAAGSQRVASAAAPASAPRDGAPSRLLLIFFGISGFVAIGYEIVWSKLFGIVMEGTLYGFAAVLSAYLLGIGLGSLGASIFVDRLRDPARTFGWLHVAIGVSVAAGAAFLSDLPYLHARLTQGASIDPTHGLYLVAAPIVLVPALLFGAAFPVLMRLYTADAAAVGASMGRAVAVNTAGSIAASLLLGFWANTALGMDVTLYALILIDLAAAALVLLWLQKGSSGERGVSFAAAAALLLLVAFGYGGVSLDRTIAGRQITFSGFDEYRAGVAREVDNQILVLEGRNTIVTVSETESGRFLRTNGLPEAGTTLAPPYVPSTTFLLGVVPYLLAEQPRRALVVGLGGGNSVLALLQTPLPRIEVVELEAAVVEAAARLHEGRDDPVSSPRVEVRVNDGRNELLRRSRGEPALDVIASQPSHPWLIGAANLFTEEYFRLARTNLREGGVFAVWLNGFRIDAESLLAVVASFEQVFPGSILVDVSQRSDRRALLLVGGREPVVLNVQEIAARMAEPSFAAALARYDLTRPEDLLARVEAPLSVLAPLAQGQTNTDDNAFVETRIPRLPGWNLFDFLEIETRLEPDAPLLPALAGAPDWPRLAERIAAAGQPAKLDRLIADPRARLDEGRARVERERARLVDPQTEPAAQQALRRLAATHPDRPEALRALGLHLAGRKRQYREAARLFAEAHGRSGATRDAFDAARALDHVDESAAHAWMLRIPEVERQALPRLALFEAKAALREGRQGEQLEPLLEALVRYRDSAEGRRVPGVAATLAALARAAGAQRLAISQAEADRIERERLATPLLARARSALAEGRLGEAAGLLGEASKWVPASRALGEQHVRLAVARGDLLGAERALLALRSLAPSPGEAIGVENRLRRELGLALLPPLSFDDLRIGVPAR